MSITNSLVEITLITRRCYESLDIEIWSEFMVEIKGKYNIAKVFTDNLEEKAAEQILELCSQEFIKDSKIRIMPDTHI